MKLMQQMMEEKEEEYGCSYGQEEEGARPCSISCVFGFSGLQHGEDEKKGWGKLSSSVRGVHRKREDKLG